MERHSPNLNTLLRDLAVPAAEHAALAECAASALEAARRQEHFGAPVTEAALVRVPRLLGRLAVAVVRHPGLSSETKLKVARHTLQRARPLEDHGTPRGLTVLAAYLAGAGGLDLASFTAMMKMAEMDRTLFDEVQLDDLLVLSDWLIAQPGVTDRQRLWWLWFLTSNCDNYRLGQAWADYLLAHPALAEHFKHNLCEAWLSPRPPGPPPSSWQALDQALTDELRAAEADLPAGPAEDLDGPLLSLLDDADDPDGGEDDVFASLSALSHLMRGALGGYVMVPHYLERRAVLGLAQTGGDPLAVCRRYLDSSRDEGSEALNQGVADILRACHAQLPPTEVQALIEKGLTLLHVPTRKTFYTLAAELYGPSAWQRAAQDPAASLRAWADKQVSGTKPRRRRR